MSAAATFYFHLPSLNFLGVASNTLLSWFTHLGVLHSFTPSAHPPHHQLLTPIYGWSDAD